MNKKIVLFLTIFFILLTVTTVSACENTTDDLILTETNSSDVLNDYTQETLLEQNSTDDIVIDVNKSCSEFYASDIETYTDLKNNYHVKLQSNGSGLANKQVKIILNGVTYNKITNNDGGVSIEFKLKTGTYNVQCFFYGDDNYTASNTTSKITVKSNIVTFLNVVDKDINYRQGLKSIFQIRLVDIYNKAISGKNVFIKVNGKTYKVKTNTKGYATIYLSLKKGSYNIKYWFDGNAKYLSSSGTFKIIVKAKLTKGNGYWVNKWDMTKVNLKKLSKKGTKHIFLLHTVFSKYGEKKVLKWINKAHKYGIKVHIWISVFYKNGKFIHPVSKKGVYNYDYMDTIISQAKHYASLKGVDGIHFDYVRFGGNAYKYKNAVSAVNYFIKKASISVRSVNPNIIVSAAVMPEPTSMKHYYAQDVPTMSKYLDVVIPMIYKGNYHASSKWIKKTTKKFVKQSKGAQIWSGLQSYKSDSNIKKLSYTALFKDAKYAKKGGASGVVLFRWGLSALLNFKKL